MKQNSPWGRVVVEGIVIVVSILLAFGIDAWWNDSQARDRERSYLVSLQQEFTLALEETSSFRRQRALHAAEALIGQAQGAERAPLDSLYLWASGLDTSKIFIFDHFQGFHGDSRGQWVSAKGGSVLSGTNDIHDVMIGKHGRDRISST